MLIDRIKEKFGDNAYITTKELIDIGTAKSSISYLVSSGKIKRVSRGIYCLEDSIVDVMYVLHNKYKTGFFLMKLHFIYMGLLIKFLRSICFQLLETIKYNLHKNLRSNLSM